MKLTTKLEDIREAISFCLKCGSCTYGQWPQNTTICPIYSYDKCFTFSPPGLLYSAQALLDKRMSYNESIAELVFTCSGCGACDNLCGIIRSRSPYVGLWDAIRLLRNQFVKRGIIPDGIKQMYQEVLERGDYLDDGQGADLEIPETIEDENARTVLYAECFHTEAQLKIYESALKLLEKMGKPITLFADGGCCGSMLYDLGYWNELQELLQKKLERMGEHKGKEFLFINPHCQEFLTKSCQDMVPESEGIKSRHFSEILVDSFQAGKIKSKKLSGIKVSYHDPCYLGRGLGIYEPPREALSFLDGVELVEMKRIRENSFCCGARAFGNYFPNFSEENARMRLEEFLETGADLLITCCPYCKEIFQKVMAKEGNRIKDLIEFIDECTQ